ncbi:serine hydrolase FSH [Aspergillus bertholletiae]|uniref:Serine hydrolase FSH n=1 Tax=Aspergillus bertholletiae TaxID=1226010 RepID=A0A5N7BFD8_9EURO|nr:serine hydrolase FSH [Aspergillus bertholletiae]
MRILCLHGAGTNSEIFKVQLGPLIHHLLKDDATYSFEFIDAEVDCTPAEGIQALSLGPFREWYTWDFVKRVPPKETVTQAIEYILSIIEEDGPFDGVIGFSQGGAIVSALLAHYSNQHPLEPQTNLFKFAVFICSSRPFTYDGGAMFDAGVHGQVIRIPTAHIVGRKDMWYKESLGLHALCDRSWAKLYDHGQGHFLPVNQKTTVAVADILKNTASRAFLTC